MTRAGSFTPASYQGLSLVSRLQSLYDWMARTGLAMTQSEGLDVL
jgi:hypothetical protein